MDPETLATILRETADQAGYYLVEADRSHNDIREILRVALRAEIPPRVPGVSMPYQYVYVRDVFADAVVYEHESGSVSSLLKRPYTLGENNSVTFGDAVPVVARTVYDPVTLPTAEAETPTPADESLVSLTSDIVPLIEAGVRKDGTVPVRIINSGWGSSGYYSAAVLKRDGPKIFKSGLHMHADHPTATEAMERPERSVSTLVATLASDAKWNDTHPSGPGLYAEAQVVKPWRETLGEIAPHIGVSIRANGRVTEGEAEGKRGKIISELVSAESVDFVTQAGRGGAVLPLLESARARMAAPVVEEAVVAETPGPTGVGALTEAQLSEMTSLQEQVRLLRERELLRDARDYVTGIVGRSDLHELTKSRLVESLIKVAPLTEGKLDAEAFKPLVEQAIAGAVAEYAAIAGSGTVRGLGSFEPEEIDETKVNESLTGAFTRLGLDEKQAVIAANGR